MVIHARDDRIPNLLPKYHLVDNFKLELNEIMRDSLEKEKIEVALEKPFSSLMHKENEAKTRKSYNIVTHRYLMQALYILISGLACLTCDFSTVF